jgi:hypothetical protein
LDAAFNECPVALLEVAATAFGELAQNHEIMKLRHVDPLVAHLCAAVRGETKGGYLETGGERF